MPELASLFAIGFLLGTCLRAEAGAVPQGPQAGAKDRADPLLELLSTPVEVAPNRDVTLLSTPSTVSIVDRATLDAYGIGTLAEAVELASGMSLVRTTFYRDVPTSRGVLQEHYANRMLLLINGVPSWMGSTGAFTLSRIDIADVERIEILKGPASVLYGSNAFSGAINVILRRPVGNGGHVRAGLQDGGGHRTGVQGQLLGPDWDLFLSGSHAETRGETLVLPGESGTILRSRDYQRSRTANLVAHAGAHAIQLNTFHSESPHLGNLVRPSGGAGQPYGLGGTLLGYQYKRRLGDRLRFHYTAALDQYAIRYLTSQDHTNARRAHARRQVQGLALSWDPNPASSLEAGITHEIRTSEDFQTFNPNTGAVLDENHLKDVADKERSIYVQGHLSFGAWQLLAGSRFTRNDNFGPNLSSRVTANCQLTATSALKFIWGQSFRAPNMLEEYTLVPGALYGRRDLKPETFDSFEVGYVTHLQSWMLQALVYHGTVRGKVMRLPRYPRLVSDPTDVSASFENGEPFSVRGVEVELRVERPGGLSGFLSADYEAGSKGDEVQGIPGHNNHFVPAFRLRTGMSLRLGAWGLAGRLQHQSATEGPHAPVPSWTGIHLNATWNQALKGTKLRHEWALGNVLDRERWYPEYVRRVVNRVPEGMGRQARYTLTMVF